jgi:hypothetical protein
LASCLVTASSEFQDPTELTPPFLSASEADPALSKLILIDDPRAPIKFTAMVRSQDYAGNGLIARLYFDFPTNSQGNLLGQLPVPIGSIDANEPRPITFSWTPSSTSSTIVTAGCHSITLMVARSYQAFDARPLRENETDFVVWWVYVAPNPLTPGGVGGASGAAGASGASGAAGTAGAGGVAGEAGAGGAAGQGGGRVDSIERCLLIGEPE